MTPAKSTVCSDPLLKRCVETRERLPEQGFHPDGMNSFNHANLGTCTEWFYRTVLGIDTQEPGFKTLVIKPVPGGTLTWAKGHYDSPHGRIDSAWTLNGRRLDLSIAIPVNTAATVCVPARDVASVTESGGPAEKAKGVKFLRMEDNNAVYAVGSGTYRFQSSLPDAVK